MLELNGGYWEVDQALLRPLSAKPVTGVVRYLTL